MKESTGLRGQRPITIESFFSAFLPISFLLMQYMYGIGTVNITICLVYAILCMIITRRVTVYKPLYCYTIWLILHVALSAFINKNVPITRQYFVLILQYAACCYTVCMVSQHINLDTVYRSWRILGIIVGIAILYQSFQIYALGNPVRVIQLLPATPSGNAVVDNWTQLHTRPVAFFTEPAMVVAYLSPLLFFSLLKKKILYSVFLSVCMLLTASTSGIVVLLIIWLVFAILSDFPPKIKRTLLICVVLILLSVFTLPVFSTTVNKFIMEISGESNNVFGRVYSGWLLYSHLDIKSMLFGISHYDLSTYIRQHPEYWSFVSQTRLANVGASFFFNTAQRIFLQTGIVGGGLYAYMLFDLFKKTAHDIKPYLICVVLIMFFELNFYNSNCFVMQYIVILAFLKDKNKGGIAQLTPNTRTR